MIHYREPAGAVLAALRLVAALPEAGLPPAHVGVAAGPVVVQGGDYFGRRRHRPLDPIHEAFA
jgi:adenylate cyclase